MKNIIVVTGGAGFVGTNLIELFLIFIISFLIIFIVSTNDNYLSVIPIVAIFAAGGIRLRPSFSKVIADVQRLKYGIPKVHNLFKEFQNNEIVEKNYSSANFTFKECILLSDISFRYPTRKNYVFASTNIRINKFDKMF